MQTLAQRYVAGVNKVRKDKGAVMLLKGGSLKCPRISTQCAVLDGMLGGGFPLGRIVEVLGDEASGKTTVALHVLAEAQKQGGVGVMIDMEHALDISYTEDIGIDRSELVFSQPDSGEEALEIVKEIMVIKSAIAKTKPLVVVIDSAAAMATAEELTRDMDSATPAPLARLLSTSLRRLKGEVANSQTLLLFTNQMRDTIGQFKTSKSTGGRALKFYTSVRLELSMGKRLRQDDIMIGQAVRARVIKNKTYPPYKDGEFRIIWGKGIDTMYSLFAVASDMKIITKKGSWYEFGRVRAQGENGFLEALKDDPRLPQLILKRIEVSKNG